MTKNEPPLYLTIENMNHLASEMNHEQIEYRRDRVIELYSEGCRCSTIAKTLQLSKSTVQRDIHYSMQLTREKVKDYLDKRLPFEIEVCRVGLDRVLEKVWVIINSEDSSEKSKLHALSLAKDCYSTRKELLDSEIDIRQSLKLLSQHIEQQKRIPTAYESYVASETTDYAMSQRKF